MISLAPFFLRSSQLTMLLGLTLLFGRGLATMPAAQESTPESLPDAEQLPSPSLVQENASSPPAPFPRKEQPAQAFKEISSSELESARWLSLAFWLAFHAVQSLVLGLLVLFFRRTTIAQDSDPAYICWALPIVFCWQVMVKACLTLLGPTRPLLVSQAGRGFVFAALTELFLPWIAYVGGAWMGILFHAGKGSSPHQPTWPYGETGWGVLAIVLCLPLCLLFTPLLYSFMRQYYATEKQGLAPPCGQGDQAQEPDPQVSTSALPVDDEPTEQLAKPGKSISPPPHPSAWWSLLFWVSFHGLQALGLFFFLSALQPADLSPSQKEYRKILFALLAFVSAWQATVKACSTLLGPAQPLHIAQAGLGFQASAFFEFLLPFGAYLGGAWIGIFFDDRPSDSPWPYGDADLGHTWLTWSLLASLLAPLLYSFIRQYQTSPKEEEKPIATSAKASTQREPNPPSEQEHSPGLPLLPESPAHKAKTLLE